MTRHPLLLSLIALSVTTGGCRSHHEPKNAIRMDLPTEKPQRPQGMKALTVKPGHEPFTQVEVTQFIRTHRLARSIGDLSQLHVDSLEFISAHDATIRLQGASSGLPDNDRVAFAVIRGPLYFTGPPSHRPVAFESAYALFDAATGNLLMSGTLNAAKPTGDTGQQPR